MLYALTTLLTVQLIGLAAFPIVAKAFPDLADRGWAISKTIGMLLLATGVWLLSYTQLVPNSPATWWVVFGLLVATGGRYGWRDRAQTIKALKRRWKIVLAIEVLFIVFFLMFLSLRAFDPAASGTEKPMDLMMLTAVTSSEHAPPQDLWLAGEPIAYYYFGYWIFGGVGAMAGASAALTFNIGIALIAGLAASIAASLVVSLVRRDGGGTKVSLVTGSMSAALLLVASNLSGLWTLLDVTKLAPDALLNWYRGNDYERIDRIVTWRPDDFWWWWKSSRITNSFDEFGNELDFTIQEFPFFSFLLGDFHPHLMSIPFVLTAVTVLVGFFMAYRTLSFSVFKKNIPAVLIASVVLGSSGFINFWDVGLLLLLSCGLVAVGWVGSRQKSFRSILNASLPMAVVWLIGLIVYSPFYLGTAESQVQWPPLAPVKYGTRPIHLLSVWLMLFLVAAPTVIYLTQCYLDVVVQYLRGNLGERGREGHLLWRPAWIVGLLLTVVPWLVWGITHQAFNETARASDIFTRFPTTGLLGIVAIVGIAVVLTRAKRGADDGAQIALVLGTLAIYLLFAAELFFVHDLFGNRMNTVFKFSYQAWIVLSVAGGYGGFVWWKHHLKFDGNLLILSRTAIGLIAVIVLSSVYFSVAAAVTKTVRSGLGPNLNSLSFLESRNSDELEVIYELDNLSDYDDVILEAVGGSYSEFGRISEASGVPTVIGWTFHETQWHGSNESFADREEDVRSIYTSDQTDEIRQLLDKYELTMVVVGPRERSTYGNIDMAIFDTLGDRIIERGPFTVFEIN